MISRLFCLLTFCFLINNSLLSESIKYPYPTKNITVNIEGQDAKMTYMDVPPITPNGQSVILFHGKNFNGYYWKDVIHFLNNSGYRVIVPDQIGWGRSTKPNAKYSFEMLAANNKQLLDSLNIDKVIVIGHSMGGMLAARFAILYPERTSKLILEDPLGLEDYKKFVPYVSIEKQYKKESAATYASYKKYQQGYYPVWKPEYEQYVKAQAESLNQKDFTTSVAYVNALTYLMIYEQPVLYDFNKITAPTLIIVGGADKTILGKDLLTPEKIKQHGNFPTLAKNAAKQIPNCKVVVLPGIGHIPHIQNIELFKKNVTQFLNG